MNKFLLVTNNPLVREKIKNIKIDFESDLEGVMVKVRDLVHGGYRLVTHPLAGSVKPVVNPYKSILLRAGEELDFKSLSILENALEKVEQYKRNYEDINYPQPIKKDYQLIDYTLLESGLERYNNKEGVNK